jgi:hypothetical protein
MIDNTMLPSFFPWTASATMSRASSRALRSRDSAMLHLEDATMAICRAWTCPEVVTLVLATVGRWSGQWCYTVWMTRVVPGTLHVPSCHRTPTVVCVDTSCHSRLTVVCVLAVDFRQPRTLVMLWFELHFGTNPPLGILMI